MATIAQSKLHAGKKPRARKQGFHLDMTPMVDLAFLLLTFFMLTTTFAKSRVMQLTMPVPDKKDHMSVMSTSAMTIVLGQNHRVYYYFGLYAPTDPSVPVPTLHTTNLGSQGIRQALLVRRQQEPEPVTLIKPDTQAAYQDVIDILDEMNITAQKKYALVPLTAADRQLLRANGQQ